jgi:hypothetical protein
MKALPLAVVSAAIGAAAGVALAYWSVGPSPTSLTPFASVSGGAAQAAPVAFPEVQVDQSTFDFGVMQRGGKETHEFVFKNIGTGPLSLQVGETSCKCTLGEVSNRPLEPGESTPVKLEWTAKTVEGPFRQVATILTNDPRQPRVELSVEGRVAEAVGLEPPDFALGSFAAGQAQESSIVFATFDQAELKATAELVDTSPNRDQYQVEVTPLDVKDVPLEGAKAGVRISLKTAGKLPLGFINDWVLLKTNVPKSESLQIPIFGVVEGDVSIRGFHWNKQANVLLLGTVKQAEGISSKLLLSTKGDHADDIEFEVAKVDPPELKVSLGERKAIRPGVSHVPLTVELPPGTKPMIRNHSAQGEDAVIELKSNHPITPTMTLNVRFTVVP